MGTSECQGGDHKAQQARAGQAAPLTPVPEEATQPPQTRLPASPAKRSLVPHLYLPPQPGAAAPVAVGGTSLHTRPVWSANTLFDADQEGEEDAPLSGRCHCLACPSWASAAMLLWGSMQCQHKTLEHVNVSGRHAVAAADGPGLS